jgi:hypothetical protein
MDNIVVAIPVMQAWCVSAAWFGGRVTADSESILKQILLASLYGS